MSDQSVELTRPTPPKTEQERAAERYGPQYLREAEIKTVFGLLSNHQSVMILGDLGQGKSTFMTEAAQYAQQVRKHGRFAHGIYSFNVHRLDEPFSLNPNRSIRTPDQLLRVAQPLFEWLDAQPQGDRLQNIPENESAILFLDASDWLFRLPMGSSNVPAYHSAEWDQAERLAQDPQQQFQHLKAFARRRIDQVEEITSQYSNRRPPRSEEQRDQSASFAASNFHLLQTYHGIRNQLLDRMDQALQDHRIRIVLTDHGDSRQQMQLSAQGKLPQASIYLMEKFDAIFSDAYRYELPASYEAEKTRLYLQRNLGVSDPILQDEIIAATGGVHKLLKLAITKDVVNTLNQTDSAEQRNTILLNAIENYEKEYA